MANKPQKSCAAYPCSKLVPADRTFCDQHKPLAPEKKTDPFYSSLRWQRYRNWYRKNNPYCQRCEAAGRIVLADVAHHIVPLEHGGVPYHPNNTEVLCHRCYDREHEREIWPHKRPDRQPQ